MRVWFCFFFFKQKTAYEMRISDWSSDVCSSDLSRASYTDPEIRRAALAGVILRMLSLGLGSDGDRGGKRRRGSEGAEGRGNASLVEDFPFLAPPDPREIADGWQKLSELGAVDDRRRLTPTRRPRARLPVAVKNAGLMGHAPAQ